MSNRASQTNCPTCGNRRFITRPSGRFSLAENCPACSSSCKLCDDTGFILETDDLGQEMAVACECKIRKRNIDLYNKAGILDRYYDATFENFDLANRSRKLHTAIQAAQQTVMEYPGNMGQGLVFTGSVGTGKSRLVTAMLREFIFQHSVSGMYVEFTHLLSDIRSGYDSGVSERVLIEPIHRVDILVIDELGKGRKSEWEVNILDIIISDRYNSGKTTIFATNYTDRESTTYKEKYRTRAGDQKEIQLSETLKERVHGRIYSRLKEMCRFVDMNFQDYREADHGIAIRS